MAHSKPIIYSDYSDCPAFMREFLYYQQTIKGLSPRSVEAYYIDLKLFLRYTWQKFNNCVDNETIDTVSIKDIDLNFLSRIRQTDILDFLYFVTDIRQNSAAARSRKLSSLNGFFKYMTSKTNQLDFNPCQNIEMPQNKKRLPKYLTLEQSEDLISNIDTDFPARDFCIITLFLNCGMRLSELVGIDLYDIKDDTIRIVGKGNKERTVYLNDACISALNDYIKERNQIVSPASETALFISKKRKTRLSTRRVQQIVENCLKLSGLSGQGYSTHKLRHTAATLLYNYGGADMLSLKEILGHENVATTEIYTHLANNDLKKIAKNSPLSKYKKDKK